MPDFEGMSIFGGGTSVLSDALCGHLIEMGYDVTTKDTLPSTNTSVGDTTSALAGLKENGVDLNPVRHGVCF
jgi:hypothetical protein